MKHTVRESLFLQLFMDGGAREWKSKHEIITKSKVVSYISLSIQAETTDPFHQAR
jgi:hypothetical protein